MNLDGENSGGVADTGSADQNTIVPESGAAAPAQAGISIEDEISSALAAQSSGAAAPAAPESGAAAPAAPESGAAAPAAPESGAAAPAAPESGAAAPVDTFLGVPIEYRDELRGLKPETQAMVTSLLDQHQTLSNSVAQFSELNAIISPRTNEWARSGFTPTTAINTLLALSDQSVKDPMGFITDFMRRAGIDVDAIYEATENSGEAVDPAIAALRQEVAELRGQLGEASVSGVNQLQQQNELLVTNFASAVASDGKLLRPYFNDLLNEIAPSVQFIRSTTSGLTEIQILEQAYDRAVYANPVTRAKLLAALSVDKNRVAKEKQAASVSIPASATSASPVNTPSKPKFASLEDEIRHNMEALSS